MKRLWMLVMLAAVPALAQDDVQKLVQLKYVDPEAVQNLLRNFGIATRADRQLKVIALSGRRAAVETAEGAIKQLDVPGAALKDIDLTAYFLVARDDAGQGEGVPADLQSTVAALKQTFPYKHYELVDALSLRSRAGSGASASGQIWGNKLTKFSVRSVNVEGDGPMIRIEHLEAGIRVLQQLGQTSQYVDVSGVHTDVLDVKEGQKLVVGRSSLDAPMRALFLVLIARVAQ